MQVLLSETASELGWPVRCSVESSTPRGGVRGLLLRGLELGPTVVQAMLMEAPERR